jgi:RNA polymerase sigma-70 factor (ECF subfamily)
VRADHLHNTFIYLIHEHERMIYKICFLYADTKADRQDLYQEIVSQGWQGYQNFRGDAKFSTWLYRVALNTAIAGFRKEKRSVLVYTDGSLPDISDTDTGNEQSELLNKAIGQLNDIEKALVMLYMDNKTYDEMENIMGISSGALRVKMTRIKEKLKTITKTY